MKQDRRLAHVEIIPIRWGDMDAMGHVNNTVYFRYMEQARIGWFDTVVPGDAAWHSIGIVIVNASCHYRRPMTYPGEVEIKLSIGRIGRSSVATYYDLHVDGDADPYATGEATVVFIDMTQQRPVSIPDTIREQLESGKETA